MEREWEEETDPQENKWFRLGLTYTWAETCNLPEILFIKYGIKIRLLDNCLDVHAASQDKWLS